MIYSSHYLFHLCLFIRFRLRLFSDSEDSQDQWDDLAAVITPCSKNDNSFDSGFKSQSDLSVSSLLHRCFGLKLAIIYLSSFYFSEMNHLHLNLFVTRLSITGISI